MTNNIKVDEFKIRDAMSILIAKNSKIPRGPKEFFTDLLMFMNYDIYYSEDKDVDDLYIETEGTSMIIKGTIPKHYTPLNIAYAFVDLIMRYLSLQPLRGKNLDNKLAWIRACFDINLKLLGVDSSNIEEIIGKGRTEIYNQDSSIYSTVSSSDKSFSDSDADYYSVLDKNMNLFNSNDLIESIMKQISKLKNDQSTFKCNSDENCSNKSNKQQNISDLLDNLESLVFSSLQQPDNKKIHEKMKEISDKIGDKQLSDMIDELIKRLNDINRLTPDNFFKGSTSEGQKVSNEIKSALKTLSESKLKGSESSDFEEFLKKVLDIKLPFDEIMKKALSTMLEKSETYRWNFPNIIMSDVGYFPSKDYDDVVDNIFIFIDTSGSMSTKDLEAGFGVVKEVMEKANVKNLYIIQHDYDLKDIKHIEVEDFDVEQLVNEIKIYGRGGTSHERPLKEIIEKINNDELPMPSLLLFFSDFVSDFENCDKLFKELDGGFYCIVSKGSRPPGNVKEGDYVIIE